MITEIMLLLSWGLSLAFVFTLGVGCGFRNAHRQRLENIEALKGVLFSLIEKVFPHENKTGFVSDSYGVGRSSVQDEKRAYGTEANAGIETAA